MKAFYILKPDALKRTEVLKAYKEIIGKQKFIKNREQFIIDSWVDLSCLMYDPYYKNLKKEELIKIRRQLLTTIKGYDYLYKDAFAVIDIFDIPNDVEKLKELEKNKYLIRNNYVLNTDKNYFKFLNLNDNILLKNLSDINIRELPVIHEKTKYNEDLNETEYKLAFLNCIHISDPDFDAINRDLDIIENSKLLRKKIKL